MSSLSSSVSAVRSHHVDDRVLAEIRAKLSAARLATQRPTVSYRVGQAPLWASDVTISGSGDTERASEHQEVEVDVRGPVEAIAPVEERAALHSAAAVRSTRVVRRAEVVDEVRVSSGSRAAIAAVPVPAPLPAPAPVTVPAAAPTAPYSELAVPEPEDELEDDSDSDIRQRRSSRALHSSHTAGQRRQWVDEKTDEDEQRARGDALFGGSNDAEEEQQQQGEQASSDDDDEAASVASNGSSPPPLSHRSLAFKPTFKPRSTRVTLEERDKLDGEEWSRREAEQQQHDRRRQQAREQLRADMERAAQRAKQKQLANEYGVKRSELTHMPDDSTDSDDEDGEKDAWKLRELHRIKRDTEALRRAMQEEDEERPQEAGRLRSVDADPAVDRELLQRHGRQQRASVDESDAVSGEKRSSMRFLQRYYHVGAFFADERESDEAFKRNFNSATGEDATVDKSMLPAVMQVKHFGLKGRTKYTHLADQDTSHTHSHKQRTDGSQHGDTPSLRRAAEVGVRGYRGKGAAS